MKQCGHKIGRDTMTGLIRSLISEKKYEIKCLEPNCRAIWDFKICRNIGVFTQEEVEEF